MKTTVRIIILLFFVSPLVVKSQCTLTNATSCQCPPGGGTDCDLIPDITIVKSVLNQPSNYTEYPQTCPSGCGGNEGRLRIGVYTPIIGFGPLETRGTSKYVCGTDTVDAGTVANIPAACPVTGLPPHQLINQRIYHKSGNVMTYTERAAGSMTYHPTHGHQHVDNWGIYTLRSNNGDPNPVNWPIIGTGSKLGFCLLDLGSCNGSPGYCTDSLGNTLNSSNIVNYGLGGGSYSCSNTVQGITNGYMDIYSQSLDGMWINLPPGLCNGQYWVVIQIDPMNYFLETNENNNVVAVPITLTQQSSAPVVSVTGSLNICPNGSVTLTASSASNYLWSTGETTQSIVVTTAGTYTVSTSCGATNATSTPVVVTDGAVAPTILANGPINLCPGGSVTLTASSSLNYLWSTGETTQSIVVTNPGSYTVSTTCNSNVATSAPAVVSNMALPVTVTASTTNSCNGNPVQLTSSSGFSQYSLVTFNNNTPLVIPDNVSAGVTSTIAVSGINPATLTSATVVSVNLNLTHTYDGDLAIQLISPSGNSIFLSNRRGVDADNFINTVFTMSASTLIAAGTAPFTGSYVPDGNFSTFTGNANGNWQLKVQDLAATDTGRVQNWSITFNSAVPETFSYAWSSNPAGFSSSQQNPVVNPVTTTSYSVLVTSQNTGCMGTAAVTITSLNVNATANPQSTGCNGDPVQLGSSASSPNGQTVPVVFTTNVPVSIPDNNSTGVTSPITVSGINPATLTATSVVSVKINLTHTYDADLRISLISPSGITVILSNQRGGSADNFINTVFTMSAATLISAGSAPFTGSYVPEGNFNTFTGNANGTWLLKAQDLANVDTGRIQNWSITINNITPETYSYSWASNPPGFSSLGQNPTVNPTGTTTYTVTVTSNLTGCVGTSSIVVTTPPLVAITSFTPSSGLPGSTVTINGTGFIGIASVRINGVSCSYVVINNNQIQAIVPNVTGQSGLICVRTPEKCNYCSTAGFTINTSVSLNLKVLIQGLYSGNGHMNPALYTAEMSANPVASDSVTVELHNTTSPFAQVMSAKGIMNNSGNVTLVFPSSVSGNSYYLAIRHRNSIETWSKNPVLFTSPSVSFDLTTP
jgi:subtilisin-like proprotein convertase family protein